MFQILLSWLSGQQDKHALAANYSTTITILGQNLAGSPKSPMRFTKWWSRCRLMVCQLTVLVCKCILLWITTSTVVYAQIFSVLVLWVFRCTLQSLIFLAALTQTTHVKPGLPPKKLSKQVPTKSSCRSVLTWRRLALVLRHGASQIGTLGSQVFMARTSSRCRSIQATIPSQHVMLWYRCSLTIAALLVLPQLLLNLMN
jgi:hypothetical protein